MLTVQKFGGSSLADGEKLRRAAQLAVNERRKGRDVVVVVSAMGGATDELLAMAYSVSSDPEKREIDALLSTGECASAALCAIALEALGQRAVSLAGWQSGIFTDAVHGEARIRTLTAGRIRGALAHGIVPVVSGFQGIDRYGDVTTLGRGGSDTTAVALAAALQADVCDIYTDVAGIYTADPRLVPSAKLLAAADTRDMLRLSYAGAQVLHAVSLETALEKGVELRLRSADGVGEGTLVRLLEGAERKPFAGLALNGGRVTLVGREAGGRLTEMRACLAARGITCSGGAEGQENAFVEVDRADARLALAALHERFFPEKG